jgi:hypothetical protein
LNEALTFFREGAATK